MEKGKKIEYMRDNSEKRRNDRGKGEKREGRVERRQTGKGEKRGERKRDSKISGDREGRENCERENNKVSIYERATEWKKMEEREG